MQQMNASIGRWQGTGLLVTTMLGTGVFVLPQLTIELAGSMALLSWALLVIVMLPVTLVFAALGQRFPHAGGPAQFVEQAFSPRQGHIIGLMFLLLVPIGAPAAIELTMEFVNLLIPVTEVNRLWIELILVATILLPNWRGIRASGISQTLLTILIIAIVVILLAAHPSTATASVNTSRPIGFHGLASAFGLAMWSFVGVETMTHLINEFKNPQRDFQVALLTGVVLVGLIYLGCTWLLLPVPASQSLSMSIIFNDVFGAGGRWIIGIIGTLSGLATINVYVASVSRLTWSLSQQGLLPAVFSRLNRHNIPGNALIAQLSTISLVLILSAILHIHYGALIKWTNGVFVIIYLMTMISAWRLLPKYRTAALIGIIVCIIFALSLGGHMLYALLLWSGLQLVTMVVGRPLQQI